MRLHRLQLRAVGPFAGEQVVDFDRLSAGGLFLFEGPTGVGKSTILDALTFALYGGLASDAGDAARLRSDFAAPEVRPEVQLEFSLRGGRHRITRSPEHLRPKRRGEGFTREKASVLLEGWQPDGWAPRSHAKDEVGALVTDLVGLNRDQFRQVVLLPQGEFATFLRADDDQRRDVLMRLFGTHFYRAVSEQLQQRAQEAGRRLQALDTELVARVAAACEAAGLAPQQHAEVAALPTAAQLEHLGAIADGLADRAQALGLEVARAEEEEGHARAAAVAAAEVVDRVARRAELQHRLDELESDRLGHENRSARLRAGRRASSVRPLIELADALDGDIVRQRQALVGGPEEHLVGRGSQPLLESARARRTEAGSLRHIVDIESSLEGDERRLSELRSALAELASQEASVRTTAEAVPVLLQGTREQLASLHARVARIAADEALLEVVGSQLRAATRVTELEASLPGLLDTRRAARRALNAASDEHDLLLEQRLTDMRGELSARLVSGDPCLVCGSADHPAPAATATRGVTEVDVQRASEARQDARLQCDEAEIAVIRAESELEHARASAAGLSAAEAEVRLAQVQESLSDGRRAAAELPLVVQRVADLDDQGRLIADEQRILAERVAEARSTLEHEARELHERHALVDAARGGCATVVDRVARLLDAAVDEEIRAAAVADLARALSDREHALTRADAEARDCGFADLDDARAAIVPAPELEQLAQGVAAWESAEATARAQLGAADLMSVAGLPPDQAMAEHARAEECRHAAERALREARQVGAVAQQRCERFAQRLEEALRVADQRADAGRDGEQVVALDQYARGMAGQPRMSLVTFVLRYWFEQVVAAANIRLDAMSSGKYHLVRHDEAARRDARVGLGLAVLDRHTGRERSPGTLSGGESFYTSLALALGLADVVTAQAGGAQLDTLFIDEGFGSLDPDTLDDVMSVIDDLRGNGRVVGIVSHVPELKERIGERLSVRRTRPDGPSEVRVIA